MSFAKQLGAWGVLVVSMVNVGCGAAGEAVDDAATEQEEVGAVTLPLDATCSLTIDGANAWLAPGESGNIEVYARAQCGDFAPLEYRFRATTPKSKTLLLRDWSASYWANYVLPVDSAEGTYTLTAEARRAGTATVVAAANRKVIAGRSCVEAQVYTTPSGTAALGEVVVVEPHLYCQGVPHEWRLSVAKPGGGTLTYPWQQAPAMNWSTSGLNAGVATLTVSARNQGNTVIDITAKQTLTVGPFCNAPTLNATGSGSSLRTLTATASCVNGGTPSYRLQVTAPNGTTTQLRDFDSSPTFAWNVTGLDGAYNVRVDVRAEQSPTQAIASKTLKVSLGTPCTKLTVPDLWGAHVRSQPLEVTATANCNNAEYQFQRRVPNTTAWTTVCPYSPSASCDLALQTQPVGDYVVRAMVRKQGSIAAYDAISTQRDFVATDGQALLRTFYTPGHTYNLSTLSSDGRHVLGQNFRWSRPGGAVALDRPDDAPSNLHEYFATDLNDAATIVSGWDQSAAMRIQPYRLTSTAQWLLPQALPFHHARANATSASGSVIVGYIAEGTEHQAFRWTSAGLVRLGDLPLGHVASSAADVSADGSVVVGTGKAGDHYEGFHWTAATGMLSLGLTPGDTSSDARSVSRDGKVVVGQVSGPTGAFASRWTAASGLVRLPQVPGAQISGAVATSGDGKVAVGFANLSGELATWLWSEADGTRLISEILAAQGVDLSGWYLEYVSAISADGKTILGSGNAPGVGRTGWLVTLPERLTNRPAGATSVRAVDARPLRSHANFRLAPAPGPTRPALRCSTPSCPPTPPLPLGRRTSKRRSGCCSRWQARSFASACAWASAERCSVTCRCNPRPRACSTTPTTSSNGARS